MMRSTKHGCTVALRMFCTAIRRTCERHTSVQHRQGHSRLQRHEGAMDVSTSYLGMKLAHPFIAGASPFGYRLDTIKRLEDAGCAAIVLPLSLIHISEPTR